MSTAPEMSTDRKLSVSMRGNFDFIAGKFKKAENYVAALLHRTMGYPEAENIDESVTKLAIELMFKEEAVEVTFIFNKEKTFAVPGLPPRVKLAPRPLLPAEAQPSDSLLFMEEFIVIPILVKAADDILNKPGRDIVLTRSNCVIASIVWKEWQDKKDFNPIH